MRFMHRSDETCLWNRLPQKSILWISLFCQCPLYRKKLTGIFRLTSVTKNIFSKIQLLRWKDAVFTFERQIHRRIFWVSGIMSLGRTISAQFKVKVRFTHFFTDPPLVRDTLDAISQSFKVDCGTTFHAACMCACAHIGENLLSWKIRQRRHVLQKNAFFSILTPHVKNIFSKIPPLRYPDAVFTVARPEHGPYLCFLDDLPTRNRFWDMERQWDIYRFFVTGDSSIKK